MHTWGMRRAYPIAVAFALAALTCNSEQKLGLDAAYLKAHTFPDAS